jgi:transcription elongation factor Elf1
MPLLNLRYIHCPNCDNFSHKQSQVTVTDGVTKTPTSCRFCGGLGYLIIKEIKDE